jgi:hypothetical protein
VRFLFDVFRLSSCPHEATSLTYTTVRATRAGLFETVRLSSTCWVRSHSARGSPCLLDLSRVCQRDADARRRLTPCSAASPPRPPRPPAARGDSHRTGTRVSHHKLSQNETARDRAEIFELAFRFQYPASHQFDTYTQQTTRQSGGVWTCCRASAFARRGRPMKTSDRGQSGAAGQRR